MKRFLINIFTLCVFVLGIQAQSGEFNPASPSDPGGQDTTPPKHHVTINISPSAGGTVSATSFDLSEGSTQTITATNNTGYQFVGWYVDDKLESQSNPVTLTMRNKDIVLTARFRFDPTSPDDPGINYYDVNTGTVIIDRFTPGKLDNALSSLLGSNSYNSVTSLTIVGEMTSYDYGVFRDFSNVEVVDLSRTTGYTSVRSSAFSELSKLWRVILPTTVETIGNKAFYGCSSLSELVLYAPAPPTASQSASSLFKNVSESLVVRVPAGSVTLYGESELWSSFALLPIDMQELRVNLSDEQIGIYENMYLGLLDMQSGQMRRYVITKRNSYSFSGVFNEATYQLTLRNAQNKVFGQEMISFKGKDTTVTFSSLLRPVDLSVRVVNDKNEDVTSHTAITWTDGEGKYLNKGTTLTSQAEGDIVYYQIALDETAGVLYQQPDAAIRVVADVEQPTQAVALKPHAQKTITGVVIDSITSRPIGGASLVATQLVNGKFNKISNAISSGNGSFSLQLIDAPFDVIITATNYKRYGIASQDWKDNKQVKMTEQSGPTITYSFRYIPAVVDEEEGEIQEWYNNHENISFALFNKTKNIAISEFEIQEPRILLIEDVAEGDEIQITLSSRINDFMPIQKLVIMNNKSASVAFDIKELGVIESSFQKSSNTVVVGCLYDAKGKLIKSSNYDENKLTISHLPDGDYTLVTMGESNLFNTIYDIKNFAITGLIEGTDYIAENITVASGRRSIIKITEVPAFDESKFYYTGKNTSFSSNKSSIVIGNYITFSGRLDFKSEYASHVSNVQLVMDIPEGCTFIENSVMIGNKIGSYTLDENQVVVPLENFSERVRFCAIPTERGIYAPNAYVRFKLNENVIAQPIGNAIFTAKSLSISVPSVTNRPTITVSGTALGKSDVEIYDNGVMIGQISSSAGGSWSTKCELINVYNLSTHSISAKIKSSNNIYLETETKDCVYDKNAIQVSKVTMYHRNPEMGKTFQSVFNFINPSNTPNRWTLYYPKKVFSYTIEFTDNSPDKITDVILYVHTADGQKVPIEADYDEQKKCWVADIDMGNDRDGYYPVNVSVDYNAKYKMELDADLFHDLLSAYSGSQEYLKDELEEFDNIYQQWETANEIDDDEVASQLLQQMLEKIGFSEVDLLSPGLDEATKQQLIKEAQLYEDTLSNIVDNLLNPDIYSNELVGEYMEGVSVLTTEGLTKEQLLQDGYEEVVKTDSTFYYILYGDTKLCFVDLESNLYIVANEQSSIHSLVRRIKTEDKDWATIVKQLGLELNRWTGAVMSTLDGVVENLYKLNEKNGMLVEDAQKTIAYGKEHGMSRHTIKSLEKDIAKYAKAVERNDKIAVWIETRLSLMMSGVRTSSKVAGKAFSIFNLGMDVWEGIEKITKMQYLHDNIEPPCEKATSEASKLKSDVHGWVNTTGSYYVVKLTSDIAEVCGIAGGIAALIPSGGTSATAIAAAFAVVAANIAADLVFSYNYDNAYSKFEVRYRKLYQLCDKLPCDGQYPCPPEPTSDDKATENGNNNGGETSSGHTDDEVQIDPSGFVYEGVESNRIEGVQATIYYKESHENMFGEMVEKEVLWNAEEYDQENPLYTDAQGMYHWDVPQGLWQVRFEKEGYEPTQSEWLPVPPPQLEVNIPIVQLRQPEVLNAIARNDAVDIVFDKYMQPELLNTDNILVTANGQKVEGSVTLLDEQVSYSGESTTYASKARFVPASAFSAKEITLTVSNRVRSYADVPMAQTFQQTFDIEGVGALEQTQAPEPSVPDGSVVTLGAELSLSCTTEGAVIRYTMDGSTPDCMHGYVYNGVPLGLYGDESVIINAIACADGFEPSEVVQWTYTFGKDPTSVEEIETESLRIEKLLLNGQLLIRMPDGEIYNPIGQKIR